MCVFIKDPDATMDYSVDYSEWLVSPDLLVNSTWTADTGITVSASSVDASDTLSTVRLTGGTVNGQYRVANRITTSNGLITDRSIFIRVEER